MTRKEFSQYLEENKDQVVKVIAAGFDGCDDEKNELAEMAFSKMTDLLDEIYSEGDIFELSSLDNLVYDAKKELGFFVKSGNSIADRMARYHDDKNERYNPLTKEFEKY